MIKSKKWAIAWFLPIFTLVLMVVFWQILAQVINLEIVLPSPFSALKEFLKCFTLGEFYLSILQTLLRAVICYLSSFILGGLLGYFSYKNSNFKRAVKPIISILRSLPTMSIILILLMWVNENIAPIIIAFIVILPLSYSSSLSGYESLDENVFNMAKVFNVEDKVIYKKYILPSFLDRFYESSVSELLLAFKIVISGEVMSETARGLGVLIKEAKYNLFTGKLFAYTIFAVVIGVLLEVLLKTIIKVIKRGKRV